MYKNENRPCESVQNYCFSSLNMQIYNVFDAINAVVA